MTSQTIPASKEVYCSNDGKTVINIVRKREHSSWGIEIEITNRGVVKVNEFDVFYELNSAQKLQEQLEQNLNALLENSLTQSKLPFFSRLIATVFGGVTSSHKLVELTDIDSLNTSNIYCYTNKAGQHKAIFHRVQGGSGSREMESKKFPFEGLIAISKGLKILLLSEQD